MSYILELVNPEVQVFVLVPHSFLTLGGMYSTLCILSPSFSLLVQPLADTISGDHSYSSCISCLNCSAQIQALRAKVKELSEMNKMQQAKLEVTEKAAGQ